MLVVCLLFFCLALARPKSYENVGQHYSFEQYQRDFGYNFRLSEDREEYNFRKNLFEFKKSEVSRHNSNPSNTWKKALNKLSIQTEQELKAFRGGRVASTRAKQFVPEVAFNTTAPDAVINVDWRRRGIITAVKNQAECGSCWAFGSAETLESHWALATGRLVVLSEQQILDCTPNPNDCGGTGGCGGGTAELAYAKIQQMGGLSLESSYPYISGGGANQSCLMSNVRPVAKISGFVNLPSNQLNPIINYLVNKGPLVISVDASTWPSYSSGVFSGCSNSSLDLDHLVQLVGAGTDSQFGDYWLIRNSWSSGWGENGYIRISRSSNPGCAPDLTPGDGDGCNGGPSSITVCGECGILYDALYPVVSP